MTVELSTEELIAAVDEIFSSMAGMQLTPSQTIVHPDKEAGYIVSAVQIVGSWQGAVRLDIDNRLARQACANLLGVDAAELSPEDVRDAAGELANITGGSVKALLAPTCSLSLPSVVMGKNYEFSLPQGIVIQELCFSHPCGTMLVSIIERHGPTT